MFQEIGGLYISLPSTREIALSRIFKANRKLVFDAFTKPHLVKRWLAGPPGWDFAVCEIDFSVGGLYRYVWRRDIDRAESVMDGVFRDIVPERLVASEMFDGTLGAGRIFDTAVLVDHGSTTVLKLAALYETQVARDTILQSETLKGMADGYDRLDALLNAQAPLTS
jgi:uncharacterized protein YndB with AHSA1/START domain